MAPARAAAQLVPPSTGGIVELDRLLQRLTEPRRLLVIGAHPDDEDTEVLALAALGYGADAAYLSLSRGEGGQNLIGPELGEALGLLRSQELLAARATDGAQQFFTRAYDFGFSRSLEETSRFWPPDTLLKDAVRVVRRFRPHVIVTVFTGTPRDGHGQHQAAGVTARRVFEVADDPNVFPELAREEGLAPWTPVRLYRSTRFDSAATTVTLSTGELDWRAGRSFHQIAMASRSLHRSQDMGQLQRIGPQSARLQLMSSHGDAAGDTDADGLFQGIPRQLTWLTRLADSLRAGLSPARPSATAPALAAALARLDREDVADEDRARALLQQALAVAAGLVLDARADAAEVVPGQEVPVRTELFNGGPIEATLELVRIEAPRGWQAAGGAAPGGNRAAPGSLTPVELRVTVPRDAPTTQPYFLQRPRAGGLYDWRDTPPQVRGLPFEPPLLTAQVQVLVMGARVVLSREITYRMNDQARGEVRRPVRVVPPVEVRLDPSLVVWPADGERARPFTVTLESRSPRPLQGQVRLEGGRWTVPPAQAFRFQRADEVTPLLFQLQRGTGVRSDSVTARAVARLDDGTEIDHAVALVDYPHVRPTPYVRRAAANIRVAPIALPAVRRVGYIRGASDLVPEALLQVGLPLVMLGPAELARGDLAAFDAIIVGTRAYEVDSALTRHNDRLLAYVEQGGLLLVQYQQYAFVSGGYAPYPLTINRPHDRVTDETVPVQLLAPDHPAFTRPNRLEPADWDGWPQERGLYFAGTWDPAYTPLLEMSDPGLPPLRGGLLVARRGRGSYVYTGLAFFRALPAGVAGAYRLFLNLLALNRP